VLDAALRTALARKPLAARPRFSYDRKRPLDLRLGSTQTTDGIVRQALTFDAGHGRKAAYWTHPLGSGPWPVVLFSPGSDGTESTQLPDADRLAEKGVASLTVASPSALVTCRAAADVHAFVNYVVGRRRALDLLAQLPDADPSRCRRGRLQLRRRGHGRSGRSRPPRARRRHPVRPRRRDPISPAKDVDVLFRAASRPKERRWYDAPHELDGQALAVRDAWLVKLLLG